MQKLRVALVHDYIKEYGGAERVLETLHEVFPDSTVYTSVYLPRFLGPHKARFANWKIKTSWFQYIPFNYKLISPFRLLSPWVFTGFDLSDFDVVIVSATGAYFSNMVRTKKGIGKKEGAVHICYCHTPPRYLYGYATAREWKKNKFVAVLAAIANHILRMVDFSASKKVDYYIANSQEVANRIWKFYRREAVVIYPPVEVENSKFEIRNSKLKGDYYLTGGRLARAKHVDLVLRACMELGVPLKIFGRGFAGYEEELQKEVRSKSQESSIEFVGEVSDEEKMELMRGAKAFLFASEDEDFGITPIEAMSVGLPVVAYRSGGVLETVIEGKTGLFFNSLSVESLKKAIQKFETIHFDAKDCFRQAEKFSKERFVGEISEFIVRVSKK